jgi:hypothetical protein
LCSLFFLLPNYGSAVVLCSPSSPGQGRRRIYVCIYSRVCLAEEKRLLCSSVPKNPDGCFSPFQKTLFIFLLITRLLYSFFEILKFPSRCIFRFGNFCAELFWTRLPLIKVVSSCQNRNGPVGVNLRAGSDNPAHMGIEQD